MDGGMIFMIIFFGIFFLVFILMLLLYPKIRRAQREDKQHRIAMKLEAKRAKHELELQRKRDEHDLETHKVNSKPWTCPYCGAHCKASDKFCSSCGATSRS